MDELGLVSGDRLYVLCSQEDRDGQASGSSPSPGAAGVTHIQFGETRESAVCVEKQPKDLQETAKYQDLLGEHTKTFCAFNAYTTRCYKVC